MKLATPTPNPAFAPELRPAVFPPAGVAIIVRVAVVAAAVALELEDEAAVGDVAEPSPMVV